MQGEVHQTNDEYGHEISRLEHALELFTRDLKKIMKGTPADIQDQMTRIQAVSHCLALCVTPKRATCSASPTA